MLDDIVQAVLARRRSSSTSGAAPESGRQARERIHAYLDELRTTQRYPDLPGAAASALSDPAEDRAPARADQPRDRPPARAHRIVYASNHKSHTDYLVEPLVLDDNGIRPPVIAAGINLFGGPLGMLHRHVTGAIPIRRNTKDPAYLVTLKAYVAEMLQRHDLFFYPEGGRSYSGELKPAKTGLVHAALQAERPDLVVMPTAIAYDLVLEDHVLARQRVKKRQRAFARELAEMVRYAVGYHSRAFVTFGAPIPAADYDPHARHDTLELTRLIRTRIGATLQGRCRPRSLRRRCGRRSPAAISSSGSSGSWTSSWRARPISRVANGRQAVDEAVAPLETRGIIVSERGCFRVRDRSVLRYYARTIEHLFPAAGRTH